MKHLLAHPFITAIVISGVIAILYRPARWVIREFIDVLGEYDKKE